MSTEPSVDTDSTAELRQRFLSMRSPRDVAAVLGVTYSRLIYNVRKRRPSERYKEFSIPKRSGGERRISAPQSALKQIQRTLAKALAAVYRPKPSAHGFIRQRSILTNAECHAGRRHILNLDLVDFFPTIHFGRVRGMFMGKPFRFDAPVATLLAQICCNANYLPQGAPTSPMVSNIICAAMDSALQQFAKRYRCIYTRYADDLSFSTNLAQFPPAIALVDSSPTGPAVRIGDDLARIIALNGFTINDRKLHYYDNRHRQQVTGLTVNMFPNVPRRYVRELHAMLHAWQKYGVEAAEREFLAKHDRKPGRESGGALFRNVMRGKIAYLKMVRGERNPLYVKLVRVYCDLSGEPLTVFTDTEMDLLRAVGAAIWVLECGETGRQGTGFFLNGYGLVTCSHVLGPKTMAFRAGKPTERHPVEVICDWPDPDLAILKVDAGDQPQLEPGSSDDIEVLSPITILGYPQYYPGDSLRVSSVHVTGTKIYFRQKLLTVSGGIFKGGSGSPVIRSDRKVVGVAATGWDSEQHSPDALYGVIPIGTLKTAWRTSHA